MATNTNKKGSEVQVKFPRMQHYYDRYKHPRGQVSFSLPSRTKQSDLESCDINNILNKYVKTGELAPNLRGSPMFGDFSSAGDFKESLELVMFAREQFAALPSKIRDRFQNSPESFLAFCDDPKNLDEMVDMGLATRREEKPKETKGTASAGSVERTESKVSEKKDPK